MARWGQLLAEIKRPMDKRRFELVTFAAAHELRHSACTLAHGKALREFFDDAQIVAIAEGRTGDVLTPADQAMVAFARRVARDASSVSETDVAALAAHGFDGAQIFDIAAAAAGRAFFTKLLDALGVQPDAPFVAVSQAFGARLAFGRPIDTAPVATMPAA
jgi:alkylhydroperoxidase family enzyme